MSFDWYKSVNGFTEIEIEGYFSERFINLALNSGITLWSIKRICEGKIVTKVVPKDFKKLRKIARTTGCKVKILKKKGIPFLLFRYQKRKLFLVLVLVVVIIINFYNSHIWKLEFYGDFDIPIEELKQQLKDENLTVFVRKKDIDIEKLKINMALKRNDLAWIGVHIKGTKAVIDIVEKTMPETDDFNGIPCNVVAKKDGLVTKVNTKDGIATIEAGDLVQKGQLLITGVIQSNLADTRYVHADGEIYAKTWYANKVKVPFTSQIVTKTGKIENRYKIKVLNYEINFLNYGTKFEKYDTMISASRLIIFNKYALPLEVEKITYEELDVEDIKLTSFQAEKAAKNEAMNGALQIIPRDAEVKNNILSVRNYDDGIEAEVTIECIEEIGTKEKLEG